MPKAGMAMEEGTVVKWLKAEGEPVEKGEPLLEILTDKVNMEVEAQVSGTLIKILAQEGQVVPVIQVIGYIGAAGEAAPESREPAGPAAAKQETAAAGNLEGETVAEPESNHIQLSGSNGRLAATPAARRLAEERRLELSRIKPTGQHGEIKARDVIGYK